MDDEDLIEKEEMVVTVTSGGYIKRTALADFRAQRRGGKGLVIGMATKDEDVVTIALSWPIPTRNCCSSRQTAWFTSSRRGACPKAARTAQKAKQSSISCPSRQGVSIAAIMPVDRDEKEWDDLQVVFATSAGTVRRNKLSDFTNVMRNGKIAMKFEGEHRRTPRLSTHASRRTTMMSCW